MLKFMGRSRLDSQKYTVSNIIAVYEARNAIYVKRGALGLIVNQKKDADGTVAMKPSVLCPIILRYVKIN